MNHPQQPREPSDELTSTTDAIAAIRLAIAGKSSAGTFSCLRIIERIVEETEPTPGDNTGWARAFMRANAPAGEETDAS